MRPFSRAAAITLMASVILASSVRAGAAQVEPAPTPSPTNGALVQDDAKPPPWDVTGRAEYAINSWIRGLVVSALEPVLRFLGKSILATPRLDGNARVRELWRFSLGIANAALVIFVLVGAGIVSVGGLSSQLTLKELLPRVLVAGIAVNFGLLLAGQLIDVANALTLALLGAATDSSDVSSQIAERIYGAGNQSPLFLVFALAVVVLAVLVLVTYVIRVAVLVVLLAGGPLFLMTHSLPQTDHVARTWWRLLVAMIASPIIQALVLTASVKVFLSGDGVLGLTPGGLIDLLVIGCLLYLLYRIPLWTINLALRGAGSRAWATAKQQVVVAVKSAVAP
jgi:hypothetical protein